eukprot:scaffold46902_cov18-Tisochrysis_lutea.AAC.4
MGLQPGIPSMRAGAGLHVDMHLCMQAGMFVMSEFDSTSSENCKQLLLETLWGSSQTTAVRKTRPSAFTAPQNCQTEEACID